MVLIPLLIYLLKKIWTLKKKIYILENKKERKFIYRDPLEFYDIIINIDTIKDLIKKGWEILINEKRKNNIKKKKI